MNELTTKTEKNCNEFEMLIKNWLVKHSSPISDAIITVTGAVAAGAISGSLQFISARVLSALSFKVTYPQIQVPTIIRGGPFEQSLNTAVVAGVYTGTSFVMHRLRGKDDDVQSGLVAGFGAGFVGALVCGMKGSYAISNGLVFALFYGGAHKVRERCLQHQAEGVLYAKTRGMLSSLGFDHYEKNFKRGLLTDRTLPLLTDSDLQEVKIPPGARRVILDHIQREKDMKIGG